MPLQPDVQLGLQEPSDESSSEGTEEGAYVLTPPPKDLPDLTESDTQDEDSAERG